MSKLLRANFIRLFKSKNFWICIGIVAAMGVLFCLGTYNEMRTSDTQGKVGPLFLQIFVLMSIIFAAFDSLFLGTEYSDGTIRNKLAVGRSRREVYLSSFIVCAAANMIITIVYCLVTLVAGMLLIGVFGMPMKGILITCGIGVCLILAESAIFTLCSLLIQSKASVAAFTLVAVFTVLMASSYVMSRLNAPEYYDSYVLTEEGQPAEPQRVKNPTYLNDTQRKYYQFAMDFLPTGQGIQLSNQSLVNPELMVVYSVIIIGVCNLAGIYFFRRKDLK